MGGRKKRVETGELRRLTEELTWQLKSYGQSERYCIGLEMMVYKHNFNDLATGERH